jgi:CTP:molybdopterin cytidylyltransferase MocA
MGSPKHRLELQGRPWIWRQLERFQAAGGERAVVLLPAFEENPQELWPASADLLVDWMWQPDPAAPMASSLRLAAGRARELGEEAAWWLPVDVPAPAPSCWQDLWHAHSSGRGKATLPLTGGHPVLLGSELLARLTDAAPGSELRLDVLLRELDAQGEVTRGSVPDPCCRLNLNTPEAWQSWCRGNGTEEENA